MPIPDSSQPIDLNADLVDLATYRAKDRTAGDKPDALIVHTAYAYDNLIYRNGRVVRVSRDEYAAHKNAYPNDAVNKFSAVYKCGSPLLLHRKLADVLIDAAIDLRNHRGQFTVAMDALRTYDSATHMEKERPDLVEMNMLARAGNSAHNRALAVDSKLFVRDDAPPPAASVPLAGLREADEHGHMDDLDMKANNRFYNGADMSEQARENRLERLRAWQRASVKNHVPIANLLSEFWDDRVTGSPEDMWRVLSCRAMCIGLDGNPRSNPAISVLRSALEELHEKEETGAINRQSFAEQAHALLTGTWNEVLSPRDQQQLEAMLGKGGGSPPELNDFIFHEWLNTIHDKDLRRSGLPTQCEQP